MTFWKVDAQLRTNAVALTADIENPVTRGGQIDAWIGHFKAKRMN